MNKHRYAIRFSKQEAINHYEKDLEKLQKQSDLLTLGLLQEKNNNTKLKNIIIEAKICAAALCMAGLPSLKGLKEIASILNQGIEEGDVKKALL